MYNILELTSELKRLKTLLKYQILDTPQENAFDAIVKIAATVFGVPVAAITFIDEHRQWIKASVGLNICETTREDAACNHTIQRNTINIVEDMRTDERYQRLPAVTTEPFYRFYAGMPLVTENGCSIGALCILDTTPRKLNEEEKELLRDLGSVTMTQIEISLKNKELNKIQEIQDRLTSVINQHTINEPGLSASLDIPVINEDSLVDTDDLKEIHELMYKQNEYILSLLNEQIEKKKKQLLHAAGNIKNDRLKQIVIDIVSNINDGSL